MWFQIAHDIINYLFSGCCNSAKKAQTIILLNACLQRVYLGVSLGEYQLLSNCSEFGHYGYCVIHGTNYTFYVTNTYLNWILRIDWLYHYSGSSTSTIYYSYQILTLKTKGRMLPDYLHTTTTTSRGTQLREKININSLCPVIQNHSDIVQP